MKLIPKPGSLWLVVVECNYDVVRVCVSGKGFYIPGQEPCWHFDHVQEWIKEIVPKQSSNLCPWCGKAKGTEKHIDASRIIHYFHPKCWKEHIKFLTK